MHTLAKLNKRDTCLSGLAVDQDGVRLEVPDDPAFLVHHVHSLCQRDEWHEKVKISGSVVIYAIVIACVQEKTLQGGRLKSDCFCTILPFLKKRREQGRRFLFRPIRRSRDHISPPSGWEQTEGDGGGGRRVVHGFYTINSTVTSGRITH